MEAADVETCAQRFLRAFPKFDDLQLTALDTGAQLDIRAEVDSLSVQKAVVGPGDLFTVLAHSAIQAELAQGRMGAARIGRSAVARPPQ